MWPFTKKEKPSEKKTVEEEPKQPIQLKFDPVATQRWLDSKKAESEKKEPEPAPEVKLECPTCKQTLEKFSYRRFKCPQCCNWIYFKAGRLVTKEERDKIQEEYYRKAKADELAEIGITEEMIQQREQELISKTGVRTEQICHDNEPFQRNHTETQVPGRDGATICKAGRHSQQGRRGDVSHSPVSSKN